MREAMEVGGRLRVELEGAGERLKDRRRGVAIATLLKAGVVRTADSCEGRKLFASQPRDTPAPEVRNPDTLGICSLPARPQELTQRVARRCSHVAEGYW